MSVSFLSAMTITCAYQFVSFEFATVRARLDQNGTLAPSVDVIRQGQSHSESATPAPLAAGEMLHLWISKEVPDNTVEMIVYSQAQPNGRSVLINHSMPIAKEIWGECTFE